MTDSITAAMDDLQLATENYVTLMTKRIRSEMADDASDAIMRYYSQRGWEEKALLDAEMDRLMAATYREKVTDE